jgi:pantothenate kinase-related protein Tda10
MDEKTFREVHETIPQKMTEDQLKAQIVEMNRKLEAYKFLVSYVQDLIAMWPTTTMRTLFKVTKKVADLKEALELVK